MKATTQQYAKTLLELTENKTEKEISGIVVRFADILKKDGQMKNASKIIEKFSELYNAKNGIVEAQVITKSKIAESEIKKIKDYVKEKYGAKEIIINNVVDKKIKGGIIIKVGDEILDGSVANQLKRFKKELSN
jgi:F-type H+-transporting ATPase subunit delta